MTNAELNDAWRVITTANVADACIRLGASFSIAPTNVRPLFAGARCAGRALPVTHFGSVDVFLEALDVAEAGDILVIDNDNRQDEGCIGDLTVIEAATAGIAGVVLWGCHRDTEELLSIALPVFSTGCTPVGPRGVRERTSAPVTFAGVRVERSHIVFADVDGVLFVDDANVRAVVQSATSINVTERRQAEGVRAGVSLRKQFDWDAYLEARKQRPGTTLRDHLAQRGGAIEV